MPNDRGEHLKPPTNTPPERGLRTFSAARRQLGRALAGPLTALGDRLRGAPASDASKAAARSKYRLQQVLSTDRARSIEPAGPTPVATPSGVERANPAVATKRASLPAGIAGARIESEPKDPWLALAGSAMGSSAVPRAATSTLDEDLAALASDVVSGTIPRPPEPAPRKGASRSVPPPLPLKANGAANGSARSLPPPPPLRTGATAPSGSMQAPPPARADNAPTPAPAIKVAELPAEDAPAEEPIRTRSMARLLASQGHHQRALWIYDWLLATNAADDTLRSEAEALRATAGA